MLLPREMVPLGALFRIVCWCCLTLPSPCWGPSVLQGAELGNYIPPNPVPAGFLLARATGMEFGSPTEGDVDVWRGCEMWASRKAGESPASGFHVWPPVNPVHTQLRSIRNKAGDWLMDFCEANNLSMANTCFKQRNMYTWVSPHGQCRNQIDYIIRSRR